MARARTDEVVAGLGGRVLQRKRVDVVVTRERMDHVTRRGSVHRVGVLVIPMVPTIVVSRPKHITGSTPLGVAAAGRLPTSMSGEATTIETIVARILLAPCTDLELIFPS